MQIANGKELVSFAEADKLAEQFECVLRKHGIAIEPGSKLENGVLLLHKLKHQHQRSRGASGWPSMRNDMQEALGLLHLVQLVLRNTSNPEFGTFVPHLRLPNRGEVVQTKVASPTDQSSNKVFELAIALSLLGTATDIRVDDPDHSSRGTNPDVMARMPDGRTWGIACKVSHGSSPMTLFERVEEGILQIEKSEADTGIVIVSLKNRLPHESLFPELGKDNSGVPMLGAHAELDQLIRGLLCFAKGLTDSMIKEVTRERIWDAIGHKKGLPGFLTSVMTAVGVETQLGPTPSIVGFFDLCPLEFGPIIVPTRFDERVMDTLERINRGFRVL